MKKQIVAVVLAATFTVGSLAAYADQAHAAATGTITSSVNFRKQPDTSSAAYGYLKAGEKVTILSKVNAWWYQVQDDQGRTGYISTSSKYVRVSDSSPISSETPSGGSTTAPSTGNTTAAIDKIIAAGKKYLGTPYEYGSDRSNTRTFDCSDFVRQAFKEGAGVTLPSDSRAQGSYVKSLGNTTTNWKSLKPGDLMFFMEYRGSSKSSYPSNKANQCITHVGIYLGEGKVLHTYSKESGGVRIDSIENKHWEYRFMFGGSALK